MFSIFRKKAHTEFPVKEVLAVFESDWHCHLLPGIDDGAPDETETLAMLEAYVALGIKKIVATPHIHGDYYRNTSASILQALNIAQRLVEKHHLPLVLEAAAEYYADEHFLRLIEKDDLLLIDNQYLLFELPMQQPSLLGLKWAEKIQQKGYTPLLAHPERYRYWHNRPQQWQSWKNAGVCFQLNLLSLTGYYGKAEKRAAEQLLDADCIDAIGTDAHRHGHLQKLNELTHNPSFNALQNVPLLNRLG
ncbi:MAG: tyrosine-protein phosphatase [Runella sp.]